MDDYQITEDQVIEWASGGIQDTEAYLATWFAEVLNGETSVQEARENCLSIVDAERHEIESNRV